MADYIRGAAVPNAIAYELRERIGVELNGQHRTVNVLLDTKHVGKVEYDNKGYIGNDGKVTGLDSGWTHSDMIKVDDIVNVNDTEECVSEFTPSSDKYAIAVYAEKDNYDSFIAGYMYNDFDGITNIDVLKTIIGYDYVVFSQAKPKLWVNHNDKLEFCLDDYGDMLKERQTNTLVVRAIGDGVTHRTSEYSDSKYYVNKVYVSTGSGSGDNG